MKPLFLRAVFASLWLVGFSANADWMLIENQSSLHFVTTKNQNISEIHHFKSLQAKLNHEGQLKVEINLASIDSGIPIRDTRMAEKLFLADKFPVAKLTAQLPQSVMALEKGNTILVTTPAELTIMSTSKTISVAVQVTRTSDNGLVATSTQPILINATDFGLASGVEILQKLAGLSSIGLTVPVNFNLVFEAH